MNKATSSMILLLGTALLVAYGLFAALYWPVTAISADVWGAGYSQISAANLTATTVVTILWVAVTLTGSFLALRFGNKSPHPLTRWTLTLGSLGLTATLLFIPTAFASVGIYNVLTYTTPYPDQTTPLILWLGVALTAASFVLAVLSTRQRRRREQVVDMSGSDTRETV